MIITNGRRACLEQTLESAEACLQGVTSRHIIDDSGDASYQQWLQATYGEDYTVLSTAGMTGFDGAIRFGWAHVPDADYVFHLEDDFVFLQHIALDEMAHILDRHPYLAQVVLKRQPWNTAEIAAGGIVEMWPDEYTEMAGWTEHRLFFSTNPTLYRRSLTTLGWPAGEHSERQFTERLLIDPDLRFAFWGGKLDRPTCFHIGKQRTGVRY